MRLRKTIKRPRKLQDEIEYCKKSNDSTKPAIPELLQSQVVPFNPNLPPAAFPSLPFPTERRGKGGDEAKTKTAAYAQASSDDDCEMSDAESLLTGLYPKTRNVPTLESPIDAPLEDEMASSDDDDDCNVRRRENWHQPSNTEDVDNGHINPQATISNTIDWSDLCSAVQLAIISRMSESHSISKVYDMLGLYAQELGDVRRLAAQYNYQSEMEDYLTFWMQQDQLRGILRIDHTSTLRGSPEAYQEFQTRSYMHKIQAEIDESLMQATRTEVSLGKRFLGQRGIQRDMIGYWGHLSAYRYAASPHDRQILLPNPSLPVRSGLDSGYVSAVISPDKPPVGQEADIAVTSGPQVDSQTRRHTELAESSRWGNIKKVALQKTPAPVKKQRVRRRSSPRPHSASPIPADNVSAAGSSGRSRRNVRQKPEYHAAIALGLRGSGGEGDGEYGTSDENDQDPGSSEPRIPLPRLFITSDNRIRGVPASSATSTVNPESSTRTSQNSSNVPEKPSPSPSRGLSTTPRRKGSSLPLPRVVVRPPKTMSKPKQPKTIAQSLEGSVMRKFNQKLLGMPKEGNDLTKSMMKASERDTAKATPWIAVQPKDPAETTLTSVTNQRRRSETVKAPAFSPISERFPRCLYQEHQGNQAAVHSSPNMFKLERVNLTKNEIVTKSSPPATPDFTSTPASESPYVARNERSIVTETGSPIPARKELSSNAPPSNGDDLFSNLKDFTTTDHQRSADTPNPASKPLRPGCEVGNIYHRLDPVTGNVIIDQPLQQVSTPASPPSTRPPHPSSSQILHHPTPLQEAGDGVKKAAADLKYIAKELTKTALPTAKPNQSARNVEPPLGSQHGMNPPLGGSQTTSRDGPKEKRKYRKSEAQRRKEAELAERRERERRERDARLALKPREREAEARKVERAVVEPKPEASAAAAAAE